MFASSIVLAFLAVPSPTRHTHPDSIDVRIITYLVTPTMLPAPPPPTTHTNTPSPLRLACLFQILGSPPPHMPPTSHPMKHFALKRPSPPPPTHPSIVTLLYWIALSFLCNLFESPPTSSLRAMRVCSLRIPSPSSKIILLFQMLPALFPACFFGSNTFSVENVRLKCQNPANVPHSCRILFFPHATPPPLLFSIPLPLPL